MNSIFFFNDLTQLFFNNSAALDLEKRRVKDRLHIALGVLVNQVSQGAGTTNSGKVARTCFAQPLRRLEDQA